MTIWPRVTQQGNEDNSQVGNYVQQFYSFFLEHKLTSEVKHNLKECTKTGQEIRAWIEQHNGLIMNIRWAVLGGGTDYLY